jgi:hypothetical protein
MPFTPYHFGPALALALPLREYLHAPTFIIASVILDVEPFMVLALGLNYPLHGYSHTLILALVLGALLGYVMFRLEGSFVSLYKLLLMETGTKFGLGSFMVAGALGTVVHVLLDSPLYDDILPFYPLTVNPFYNPALSPEIYSICVWMGVIGLIYYAALVGLSVYKKGQFKTNPSQSDV